MKTRGFGEWAECPPCHGQCAQGRDCPKRSGYFADEPAADAVLAVVVVIACYVIAAVFAGVI